MSEPLKPLKIWEVLKISREDGLVYLLISLLILIILNSRGLLLVLLGANQGTTVNIQPITDSLVKLQDKISSPALILIWAGIGTIYYLTVVFGETSFSLIKDNRKFKSEIDKQPVVSIVERRIEHRRFIKVLAWCLAYLLVFFRWLLPFSAGRFHDGIFAAGYLHPTYLILLATAVNATAILVLVRSLRLLGAIWRPINPSPR